MYLDNVRYVAASDHAVPRGPLARLLLDRSVKPNSDNPGIPARELFAMMIDAKPRANDTRRRVP